MRSKILFIMMLITGLFIKCAWFGSGQGFKVAQSKPKLVKSAPLIYPAEAKAEQQEGTVILDLRIDEQGNVIDVELKRSSGHALLDSAALKYGPQLVFTPATWNHKPVAVWYSWRTDFRLQPVNQVPTFTVETYANKVYGLKKDSETPDVRQRNKIAKNIFQLHEAYVEYLSKHPDENYNPAIRPFISDSVYKTWASIWNDWPLRFVVYHDLINEFPESSEAEYAKARMLYLLKQDIQRLKAKPVLDPQKKILTKLVTFHDKMAMKK